MRWLEKTALVALAGALFAGRASAVPVPANPWQWQVQLLRGVPGGVIQVRENSVAGSTLPLGPGLGYTAIQRLRLAVVRKLPRDRSVLLGLDLARLHGTAVFPQPVYFNGVTVAANTALATATNPGSFWQFTALYRQRLWSAGGGARLDGQLGFTYVGLTYRFQNVVSGAPGSQSAVSGSRVEEDFITQELPVSVFGLRFRYPLGHALRMEADFLGGHLPWNYSLRNEGGKVYTTQTNQEAGDRKSVV